jgi:class 3 adenylate cyclase
METLVEAFFVEFFSDGNRMFTGILRDVSEGQRAEERLRNASSRNETLEKLAELTADADAGMTLTAVLDRIFLSFQGVIPYDRLGCALLEQDGASARLVWSRSTLPRTSIPTGYSAHLAGSSLQGVLQSGRPRILNDLQAYLREHPASENTRHIVTEGLRSSLTCPLIAMGTPTGFLFFSSAKPHAYDETHIDLFMRIAEHISLILEKGRLHESLVEAYRELGLQNQFIAGVFGRYTSEAVVSRLLKSPGATDMGGEIRKVSLLFADLCGFSQLCGSQDAERVVRILNIYLSVMTDVIMEYEGTIDEFQGDAILVIFGAPTLAVDDARRALACATAMQRAMERVNQRLSDEGLPVLEMGIAVHSGDVVVGNIGSHRRAKYGVVGQAINQVTELEAFTRAGEILCSEETIREVGDFVEWEELGEICLKGLERTMRTFLVRGVEDQP